MANPQGAFKLEGSTTTSELVWTDPAQAYVIKLKTAIEALERTDTDRIKIANKIKKAVPDCPDLFVLALSKFPDLAKSFVETHLHLGKMLITPASLEGQVSFENYFYVDKQRNQIYPDDTGGFTGWHLQDVLEAVYFLYGVLSRQQYRKRGGIIKLLGAVKEESERSSEEKDYLATVSPPEAVNLIPEIVNLMQIKKSDLELLRKYEASCDEGSEQMDIVEKEIRNKYPMQQNYLEGFGLG